MKILKLVGVSNILGLIRISKNKRRALLIVILASIVCRSCKDVSPRTQFQGDQKPNILVIMVDDMGFSDPGAYGGDIATPNIDRLAKNGVRFTHFYNAARCSPSRASLLTGQYPHKAGLHKNGNSLSTRSATLAEVLGNNDYETAMVGKWHLSASFTLEQDKERHLKWLNHQIDPNVPFGEISTYPANRGFQKFYGVIWGVVNYFDPFSLVEGTEAIKEVPEDYYITDAISAHAVNYMDDFSKSENPFFMYVAYTAPHWPLHAKDEDIAKYEGVFDEGWDAMRERRFKKQVELGLFDQDVVLPPNMGGGDWNQLSDKERRYQIAKMEAHAAMIDAVDQGIGKILQKLEDLDQLDNTIVFFMSDNGASPETPGFPGYDRNSETRDGRKVHFNKPFNHIGADTTYSGIGRDWANAANTPFKYWKKESYEGGNNSPMIVFWPAGLALQPGSIVRETTHIMDIFPTVLDITNIKYPDSINGEKTIGLDGKSFLPHIEDKEFIPHKDLFFEHEAGRAVQSDGWKLVSKTKGWRNRGNWAEWELYNLKEDPTEMNELSVKYPEKKEALEQRWDAWWDDMQQYIPEGERQHSKDED